MLLSETQIDLHPLSLSTALIELVPMELFWPTLDHKNVWNVGGNTFGQCGREGEEDRKLPQKITFFEKNQINIRKICVSPVGCSTFFITNDDEVCGCGLNNNDQL